MKIVLVVVLVLVLGFGLTFPNKTEDENDDENEDEKLEEEASTIFMLCGAPQEQGRFLWNFPRHALITDVP